VAKLQRERAESVAIAALFVQIVMGFIALIVAHQAAPPDGDWAWSVMSLAWYLFIGAGFWLMTWVHLRQLRLAEIEEVEWKRLVAERAAGGARGRLFEEDEISGHVARNRLRMLEKYVLPTASFVLLAALGLLGYRLFPFFRAGDLDLGVEQSRCAVSAALMVLVLISTFLIGMYASGMSRQSAWRPLRAGAGYMMSCSLLSVIVTAGLAAGHFGEGYFWLIRSAAYIIPALMIITSVEILLNFVLDFYRPRIEGVEFRPSYDSRLLGMLAEPGGIFRTVATTLDYQFGFKVSETWFYQFLERAIAPLVFFMIVSFYLLTCIVVVGPNEQAIIERFGKPVQRNGGKVIGSGIYFKLPWPISKVYRRETLRVREVKIGFDPKAEEEAHGTEETKRFIWTVKHYEKEYYVMVAARETEVRKTDVGAESGTEGAVPVGLISAVISVFYRITDLEDFLYQKTNPEELLVDLAYREQQLHFASADFFEIMGPGREKAGAALRENIQASVDREKLGIKVVRVCLHGIHPPIEEELGQAFEAVIAAEQEKQAEIHKGEAYAKNREVSASFEASILRAEAHQIRVEKREEARGFVANQQGQAVAYQAAPQVFQSIKYLDAFVEAMDKGKARKFLIASKDVDRELFRLNLEDKIGFNVEDIDIGEQ